MMGILALIAFAGLSAAVWPLPPRRFLLALLLFILASVALLSASNAKAADLIQTCEDYTTTASGALKMRQSGATKEQVTDLFEQYGLLGDTVQLAIHLAYRADPEVEPAKFRTSTLKRCKAGEL